MHCNPNKIIKTFKNFPKTLIKKVNSSYTN